MKTILILGGYGFIGSNVLEYIDRYASNEYRVVVFDKFPRHPHGLTFSCVKAVYAGDFSDESCLRHIFEEEKISLVLHLLSSTVPATSANAQYDVESNLIPTLRLLGLMDKYGVRDIVYMSSGGAIYGDLLEKVHHEEDAVYPKSSYGVVKLAIEKYLLAYAELYGFHTLILRLSNPYGKYHYSRKQGVINIAIRKALEQESFQIWGTGEGIKDYIFVEDACRIIFQLIAGGVETGVYNVAAGSAHAVNEIVEMIQQTIPSFQWTYREALTTDVQSFELDVTKLRKKLGKLTFTPFSQGIKKTIEWQQSLSEQEKV